MEIKKSKTFTLSAEDWEAWYNVANILIEIKLAMDFPKSHFYVSKQKYTKQDIDNFCGLLFNMYLQHDKFGDRPIEIIEDEQS